jgi:hypothetical protein
MKKQSKIRACGCCLLFFTLHGIIAAQAVPDLGTAAVKFGSVNGEEEMVHTSGTREISGVYPHLTTYSQSRKDGKFFKEHHEECGIGAVIPWADKLWMITYAPHMPRGSDHKLYSIDDELNMTIHAETVEIGRAHV